MSINGYIRHTNNYETSLLVTTLLTFKKTGMENAIAINFSVYFKQTEINVIHMGRKVVIFFCWKSKHKVLKTINNKIIKILMASFGKLYLESSIAKKISNF